MEVINCQIKGVGATHRWLGQELMTGGQQQNRRGLGTIRRLNHVERGNQLIEFVVVIASKPRRMFTSSEFAMSYLNPSAADKRLAGLSCDVMCSSLPWAPLGRTIDGSWYYYIATLFMPQLLVRRPYMRICISGGTILV
jgi:hypothetical protein